MADESWTVYLVECADGTLYCGVTTDLDRRVSMHDAGTGARYTRGRGPVRLVAARHGLDRSTALRLEASIKRTRRADKEAALRDADVNGSTGR